jgi:DNA-binding transcriptional regulator LsrR (DeoR family)
LADSSSDFASGFSSDFGHPAPGANVPWPGNTILPIPGHTLWRLAKPGNAITLGQTLWKIADHMPPIPVFDDGDAPVISAVGSSSGSATAQTITWVTDVASDSQVDYDPA